jgi:hypothetical protein
MSEELVKIAVLEQRLMDFVNIVTKIDDAITKLSDVNANITKMLAVHEERIEQCNKSDTLIIKMIDDLKISNDKDHKEVVSRVETVETKLEDITKFRWMAAGVMAVLIFVAPIITNHISNTINNNNIEVKK